ncbi:hypothetical protein [Polluticoccus soli]|uniref:hypothetical protein n=1 Tax=Polluticoccus soli TaxID=3034150 RepID=UPI0023E225F6|nr:hypothetical protein [Flavipsychrobacter sp. JY13-12]
MKKQVLTLLLGSLVFVACNNDDDDNPTPTPTPTTGVKAGSKFTYTRTDYDSLTGTQVIATYDYTLTMLRDSTLSDGKWLFAEMKYPNKTQYGFLKFTSDGVYVFKGGKAVMDYKFSAAVNDKWTNSNDESVVVKSLNQSVTTPAGSFTNATHIETSDANSMENKVWYNDKEFLLKSEEYDDHPTQVGQMIIDYRDELKSVQL